MTTVTFDSGTQTYGAGSVATQHWPDCTIQVCTGHIEESNLSEPLIDTSLN